MPNRDPIVWIRSLHLGVQVALNPRSRVIALEVASLVGQTPRHVDALGPADLEPVAFGVLAGVEQLQILVLEGGAECVVVAVGGDLVGPLCAADLPVENGEGFLRVAVVVGEGCAGPCVFRRGAACGGGVEEGDDGVGSEGEVGGRSGWG